MKKLALVGLVCWPVFFVDAMDPKSTDDTRKKQQETIEAQRLEEETWMASMEAKQDDNKRKKEEEQVKRRKALLELISQEKTAPDNDTTKEQGPQIAVCRMRAPSSMPIPKKPN